MPGELLRALGFSRSLLIYYGQPWQRRKVVNLYREFARPGDLVFDIGAHVGSRSRAFLSLGASVVAVEPQPDFANFIARTISDKRLALLRCAVGREPGSVDLHISSRHPTVTTTSASWLSSVQHTSGFEQVAWDRLERVEMTTLDQMISDHGVPAFCKIDVEGAEADILRGLSQALPAVAFEYIPAAIAVAHEAIKELQRIGSYRFNRTVGEKHHFVHDRWLKPEDMIRQLFELQQSSQSGDIYARLER
ncbi:FkbM family methyltransferase [Rhizobium halophilum]|uniref:FkbM family methyltransferase n=1 Tax=Rhizobium halophilum TaxID=2846852 RepID=UPI001EFC6B43|nr:FkbM family methyltransferase [Rhizobium halophilum]MCF6368019.1 FkbM family methyltransferase [Rhizobium halophilum]